jgi:hypothetical protein
MEARTVTTGDRFWAKVKKENGHWIWTGGIDGNGCGTFRNEFGDRVTAKSYIYPGDKSWWRLVNNCGRLDCVMPTHHTPQYRQSVEEIRLRKQKANRKELLNETHKLRKIREAYGITLKEAAVLVQIDHCEACGGAFKKDPPGLGPHSNKGNLALTVDHDHTTGAIRGVLHSACNRALGFMREDVNAILGLASYIKRFK